MLWIAHRGNTEGPQPQWENHPDYVAAALGQGLQVEVDLWWDAGKWYLGHDRAQHAVHVGRLRDRRIWCHAKSPLTLQRALAAGGLHVFWHETDQFTLTSEGRVWSYPGVLALPGAVMVLPGPPRLASPPDDWEGLGGICTDHPLAWRELYRVRALPATAG